MNNYRDLGLITYNSKYQIQIDQWVDDKELRATIISGGRGEADPIIIQYNNESDIELLKNELRNKSIANLKERNY